MMKGGAGEHQAINQGDAQANGKFFLREKAHVVAAHGAMDVERIPDAAKTGGDLVGLSIVTPRKGTIQRLIEDLIYGLLVIIPPLGKPGNGCPVGLWEFFHGYAGLIEVTKATVA